MLAHFNFGDPKNKVPKAPIAKSKATTADILWARHFGLPNYLTRIGRYDMLGAIANI